MNTSTSKAQVPRRACYLQISLTFGGGGCPSTLRETSTLREIRLISFGHACLSPSRKPCHKIWNPLPHIGFVVGVSLGVLLPADDLPPTPTQTPNTKYMREKPWDQTASENNETQATPSFNKRTRWWNSKSHCSCEATALSVVLLTPSGEFPWWSCGLRWGDFLLQLLRGLLISCKPEYFVKDVRPNSNRKYFQAIRNKAPLWALASEQAAPFLFGSVGCSIAWKFRSKKNWSPRTTGPHSG